MHKSLFGFAVLTLALTTVSARADTNVIYNKIIQTQTINCGYTDWEPLMVVNPNTHEISGLMIDVWEMIGKELDLKIVWKSFVGFGEVTEAVRTNKIDVFCVGVWPNSGRIKNMLLSRPALYNAIYLYARSDDTRFDNKYEALNDPTYTVVGQEGSLTASFLSIKFPKAKTSHISPMAPKVDQILNVVANKGDAVLIDVPFAEEYMKKNPEKIRAIKGPPIAIMPLALPLAIGEHQLKSMIDTTLNDLINNGAIAKLIQEYKLKETYAPEPDVRIPAKK